MEHSIQAMAGISFLIFGLSYFFNARDWIDWLEKFRAGGRQFSLRMGAMHVLLGSFIIGFHWVWSGWAMILTIIGVWALIEGFVYLLFPNFLARYLGCMAPYYGLVLRVFGIALAFFGLSLIFYISQRGIIL